MESVQVLHLGCVSSVFLASKQAPDQDQKIVKAYHKGHLQVRHWLNITREVTHLRQLKDLRLPGVVELCGTADDATNVYLVFEPCFGGDLYKRLAHQGLFDEAQLCKQVVAPLLKVLHSLHQLGIIHRDIKPENIFFEADGTLRLGDFGLAINATRERPISRVGTLDYMAPEVLAQPSADVIALRRINPNQLPSYDAKVDVWALGVLVYEALMGMTPFNDADPQAASLKAQFRAPMPLPSAVSAELRDFVTQTLAKQAAKRPSALQLLGHPWVRAHVSSLEARPFATLQAQRAFSGGAVSWASSCGDQGTPGSNSPAAPVPISMISRTPSSRMPDSCTSSCELSTSAPTASPIVLSTASSLGLPPPWQQQHLPLAGPPPSCIAGQLFAPQPSSQLVLQKPQPKQTQPQQLPPHPFAAAAVQLSSAAAAAVVVAAPGRALSGPLLSPTAGDAGRATATTTISSSTTGEQQETVVPPVRVSAPLPTPAQPVLQPSGRSSGGSGGGGQPRFGRQLSSPAWLRDAQVQDESAMQPAATNDVPSSPPPPCITSGSSSARLSALAMSPMRALLGAGRNLVRSRSGAAAPAADGSVAAAAAAAATTVLGGPGKDMQPPASVPSFSMRSPLPSPIRSLLQPRRKLSQTSSASLFAAAQWKPSAGTTGGNTAAALGGGGGGGGSGGSASGTGSTAGQRYSGSGCGAGSNSTGSSMPRNLDASSFMRSCSMGPNVVLGAGLCSQGSISSAQGQPGADSINTTANTSEGSRSASSHAAAAVAAVGPHARRLPALACVSGGSGGDDQAASGRKQQGAAMLSRYPSAPDPGLLALSPVRGAVKGTGTQLPPVAAAPSDKGGVRGMWLKVQGVCRMVSKANSRDDVTQPQDAHCLVVAETLDPR